MIVRILGEGQYDVPEESLARLNVHDAAVETAISLDDEESFRTALTALLDDVRTAGSPHAPDALDESQLILPPADASMEEVRGLLADDGLIPG